MITNSFNPQSIDEVHWRRTAAKRPNATVLRDKIEVDFAIVGGGLTGCRTAIGLAEAGAKVAVLEAHDIGFGASGRSGGQCNPIWRATPDELRAKFGEDQAARLIKATLGSADALFDDIRSYEVDCDAEQNGWVQAAHCKSAKKRLISLGEAWKSAGAPIEFLGREETQKVSGSSEYGFSLFHSKGGHVQPLSLTYGYARAAERLGAVLFENSKVTSMQRVGDKWAVTTPTGQVLAKQVILTTNAHTNGLWPGLQQTFFPMVSIALATEPLSDDLQQQVLPNAVTIADSRRAIFFARYDRDRRLIFGCVGSTDKAAALGGIGRLRNGLHRVFPQLKQTKIETAWAGRIAVTTEMMPHLHEPAPGVIAALGFSGRGIAMTSVMGRALAKRAMGGPDDVLPFPVSPVSPIPFHWGTKKVLPLGAPAMSLRDKLDTLFDPL
ncbi:FAD-binding oxidoreductase [Cognatishimia sp. WU-CL00825]|uniref:NAD(P)/FAD-dependent oxidoreductase n=1 Tax=Cognatishimia sp. WU-CL00825 TaxID=3127658 RepID=UPI00310ADC87